MDDLGSSFQYDENNYMVAEEMEEYALASTEVAYEDTGEQATMGFMAEGGWFHDGNVSQWWDQKHPLFTSQTFSDNTNWETADMHMSVEEEAIRKVTGRVNAPLEWWGCTNSSSYHVDRLHTYSNCPNNMYPDMEERAKRSLQ